ncbi:glycosyltransferase, partial [Halorussus sp. GCM10023401]
ELLERDPDLRERLAENARETAAEHTLDRVGERLAETYRELLGSDDDSAERPKT